MIILIYQDKMLYLRKCPIIYHKDNNFDDFKIIIRKEYDGQDISAYNALLQIILPDKRGLLRPLIFEQYPDDDGYIVAYSPVSSIITSQIGNVDVSLILAYFDQVNDISKSSSTNSVFFPITPSNIVDDLIEPETQEEGLLTNLIAELDNLKRNTVIDLQYDSEENTIDVYKFDDKMNTIKLRDDVEWIGWDGDNDAETD